MGHPELEIGDNPNEPERENDAAFDHSAHASMKTIIAAPIQRNAASEMLRATSRLSAMRASGLMIAPEEKFQPKAGADISSVWSAIPLRNFRLRRSLRFQTNDIGPYVDPSKKSGECRFRCPNYRHLGRLCAS